MQCIWNLRDAIGSPFFLPLTSFYTCMAACSCSWKPSNCSRMHRHELPPCAGQIYHTTVFIQRLEMHSFTIYHSHRPASLPTCQIVCVCVQRSGVDLLTASCRWAPRHFHGGGGGARDSPSGTTNRGKVRRECDVHLKSWVWESMRVRVCVQEITSKDLHWGVEMLRPRENEWYGPCREFNVFPAPLERCSLYIFKKIKIK